MSTARADDIGGDTRLLTYGELAQARGITKASATRLAFRRRWARHPGNDGTARVAVPVSELGHKHPDPHDDAHDGRHDATGDVSRTISALEGTISVLHEQLAKAEARAAEALVDLRLERAGAREERQRLLDRLMQLDTELEQTRAALASASAARWPFAWLLPWRI